MFLPTLFLLGNTLVLAPAPRSRLALPETEGKTEWYQRKSGRTDLYGDPLPEGARCRIGSDRFRFGDTSLAVSYSPDGRALATAGHEGVHLFDAASGRVLAHFTGPRGDAFDQIAFLPTDKYLLTHSYEGRLLFWNLTLGSNRPLQGPTTDKHARFALSGNGKFLAFIKDRTIRLWDIKQGKEVAQLPRQESVYRLLLSCDGKILASLGGGKVTLWDTTSRKSIRDFLSPEEAKQPGGRRETAITEFALSPNGKVLAGFIRPLSGQHVIRVWETATGKELQILQVIDHTTRDMAFSPDGHFLALASQNHLQVWDVRTSKTAWHYLMYGNQFFSVCFSADGRFVAGGLASIVKIWATTTGRERVPIPELRDVRYFSLSSDGRTVLTSNFFAGGAADSYGDAPEIADLRYWDAESGNRLVDPPGQKEQFPPFAALSSDQRTLLTQKKGGPLQVWEVETGKKQCDISCARSMDAKVFSNDGKLLLLGSRESGVRGMRAESRLELWDARRGKRLGEFKGHRGFFIDLKFSPDGKVLASIDSDFMVHLWDTPTQRELHRSKFSRINRLAFSPDNRMLAASGGSPNIELLEVPSGNKLPKLSKSELARRHPPGIRVLLFSSDSTRLFTTDYHGTVFIWEHKTGQLVKEWQADSCCVSGLQVSADGKVLLTHGGFSALLWDLDSLLKEN